MNKSLTEIIDSYNPDSPLAEASTIPAPWYTDKDIYNLELETVFSRSWQVVARIDQLLEVGAYVTSEVAGEPIVVVRGTDNELRGFFNVCRHHAAAVMTEPSGTATNLRCPYHGWTYSLEGELKGTPDFSNVCSFDRSANGLLPVNTAVWQNWVFVRVANDLDKLGVTNHAQDARATLEDFLGVDLITQTRSLGLNKLHWMERRRYILDCNWKVFVDNYLDGGYHVPHLHKGLDSVLDYSKYTIENGRHFCLQSSPMVNEGTEAETGAVRKGDRALYYWIYPNFMINCYDGVMDTNLVLPLGVNKTEVVFDFYFPDVSEKSREQNLKSIEVGQRIQDEDVGICKSVQRGLNSRAYQAGRLSVRREAGEHLFHRLLHRDLNAGLKATLG